MTESEQRQRIPYVSVNLWAPGGRAVFTSLMAKGKESPPAHHLARRPLRNLASRARLCSELSSKTGDGGSVGKRRSARHRPFLGVEDRADKTEEGSSLVKSIVSIDEADRVAVGVRITDTG